MIFCQVVEAEGNQSLPTDLPFVIAVAMLSSVQSPSGILAAPVAPAPRKIRQ